MAQEAHAAGARPTGATGAPHPLIERAMRILRHEQRTGHTDSAVKPGGLESFVARWVEDVRSARSRGELGERPFEETVRQQIAGYAGLDPMQRAAHVRSALAALESVGGMLLRVLVALQLRSSAQQPNAQRLRASHPSSARRLVHRQRLRERSRGRLAAPPPPPPVLPSQRRSRGARPTATATTRRRISAASADHRDTWRRRHAGDAAQQAGHPDDTRPALHLSARAPRLQQAARRLPDLPFDEVSTVRRPHLGGRK